MLTRDAAGMLELQNELNSLIDPNWAVRRRAWHRAIWVESAELLEHHGWKWWKEQEANVEQMHIELVDIWHFLLSQTLELVGDTHAAAQWISFAWNKPVTPLSPDFPGSVERFVQLVLGQAQPQVTAFAALCGQADLPSEKLRRMYLAKNVLNIFRQRNGYKDGSYIKVWRGHEDNVWLEKLMTTMPGVGPTVLMDKLTSMYADVVKSA